MTILTPIHKEDRARNTSPPIIPAGHCGCLYRSFYRDGELHRPCSWSGSPGDLFTHVETAHGAAGIVTPVSRARLFRYR